MFNFKSCNEKISSNMHVVHVYRVAVACRRMGVLCFVGSHFDIWHRYQRSSFVYIRSNCLFFAMS